MKKKNIFYVILLSFYLFSLSACEFSEKELKELKNLALTHFNHYDSILKDKYTNESSYEFTVEYTSTKDYLDCYYKIELDDHTSFTASLEISYGEFKPFIRSIYYRFKQSYTKEDEINYSIDNYYWIDDLLSIFYYSPTTLFHHLEIATQAYLLVPLKGVSYTILDSNIKHNSISLHDYENYSYFSISIWCYL